MIDFQSILTTTDPSRTAPKRLARPTPRTAVTFVDRDSMATCHLSRGWTLPASGKSSRKTSEGDSSILDRFSDQDTEIEVTGAISA